MSSKGTKFDGFDFDQFDPDAGNDGPKDNDVCEIMIKDKRGPMWLKINNKTKQFKATTTVKTIKKFYVDNVGLPEDKTGYNLLAENDIYKGLKFRNPSGDKGIMGDNDKLKKYFKQCDGNGIYTIVINITFKVKGGTEIKDDEKRTEVSEISKRKFFNFNNKARDRVRTLPKNKKFPLSNEECIITLKKDPKNNVYMPCKHTISPSALFDVMLWTFMKTNNVYEIRCPKDKCRKIWNWYYCTKAACLTTTEFVQFELERQARKSPAKLCQNCGESCERPKDLRYYRVACSCRKGDWCFECGKKWIGGGFAVCGNNGCHTSNINGLLKNCALEHSIGGAMVPQLRACPTCYNLIEHTRACKHMQCKSCGNYFCFVCLYKPQKNNDGKPVWNNCGGSCVKKGIQTIK